MDAATHLSDKQEVVRETKGDKLNSHTLLTERLPATMMAAKDQSAAAQHLPAVEFVITQGQKEDTYRADGSISSKFSDSKIDPNCSNSVKTASGSEQRFDASGLCRLSGNVHWDKTTSNSGLEVTLDDKVTMKLDRNFQLKSVQGKHASYDRDDANVSTIAKTSSEASAAKPAQDASHQNDNKTSAAHSAEKVAPKHSHPTDSTKKQAHKAAEQITIKPLNLLPQF